MQMDACAAWTLALVEVNVNTDPCAQEETQVCKMSEVPVLRDQANALLMQTMN